MKSTLTALLLVWSTWTFAQTKALPFALCDGQASADCSERALSNLQSSMLDAGFSALGHALNDSLYFSIAISADGQVEIAKSYSYLSPKLKTACAEWLKTNLLGRLVPGAQGQFELAATADLSELNTTHRDVFDLENKPVVTLCANFNERGQDGCLRYLENWMSFYLEKWHIAGSSVFRVYISDGAYRGIEILEPFVDESHHDRILPTLDTVLKHFVSMKSLEEADPFYLEFKVLTGGVDWEDYTLLQFEKMQNRLGTGEQVQYLATKTIVKGEGLEKSQAEFKALLSAYNLPQSGSLSLPQGKIDIDSIFALKSNRAKDIQETEGEVKNFMVVETVPVFEGCNSKASNKELMSCFQKELAAYVGKNFNFPTDARRQGIGGRVFVQFVIEKDGHADELSIPRGVHYLIDLESIRVVSEMPKCKRPAVLNGKAVRMSFTLPINARIE